MEVILLEKVKNLGALGDKVKVNLEAFEQKRSEYEAKANKLLVDAQSRAASFADAEATISANASPEGKLFGSVGPREIAEAFTAQGKTLEKSEVIMPEGAIHNTGDYEVEISLHADVKAPIKVHVVAEA